MTTMTVGPTVEGLEDRSLLTFGAVVELSGLTGADGFKISGVATDDYSGRSVSDAGDINGDGIDDLIIGARAADPNGTSSGASYVVFGSSGGFLANLNLSALDGTNGFRISGVAADDLSGRSVSAAGDIDGDGIDDLIIGAFLADPNGSSSGASYVVFGSRTAFAANLNLWP
jgi:FG-GAP repeat protein